MQKEESTLEVKENFSSLQEEVDVKTKKLNKVAVFSYTHSLISCCAVEVKVEGN